jgi:hypothetical protein
MNIDVEFYELPDGSEPARVFLDGLDRKMRAKMYREIDLLVMNGPELREPHLNVLMMVFSSFVRSRAVISAGFFISFL